MRDYRIDPTGYEFERLAWRAAYARVIGPISGVIGVAGFAATIVIVYVKYVLG